MKANLNTVVAIVVIVGCTFGAFMVNAKTTLEENKSKTILTLIDKGVNSISARCAIADDDDKLCTIYVATYKGEVK